MLPDAEIEAIFNTALLSTHGCIVETSDPNALRQKMYITRVNARNRGLNIYDVLSFRMSPNNPTTEVWVIKDARRT